MSLKDWIYTVVLTFKHVCMDTQTTTQTAVTVNQILERYERDCLPKLAPMTQVNYRYLLKGLRREFGPAIAEELRPKDFGPFLQVKRGQVNRVRSLAVLSSAFTQAVSFWYVLAHNVLRDVHRPRFKPRDRLISDAEFYGFKAMLSPRIQLAMMLALLTGQRQGDILNFRWADIRDMALHVRQSKTGKRIAIEITPDLEAVLDECWRLGNGGQVGNPFVLPTRSGKPYTGTGFRACWQRAMRKWIKLGNEPYHYHDIRAMAATRCATPEIAMRLLGHTTLAMTMRVYRRGVEKVKALELRHE